MKTINHSYFGVLNFDIEQDVDYIWENEINGVDVALWYDSTLNPEEKKLDFFADFLNNMPQYKQKAITALIDYLKQDNEYIRFHIDELEMDFAENPQEFVKQMTLTSIGLWMEEESFIIMDFMISPQESDEILAVKFNASGEIYDIAWES